MSTSRVVYYADLPLAVQYVHVPPTLKKRATRGATFFDEREPGWFTKIDLKELNLDSPRSCVLGQLHGDYFEGLSVVDIRSWSTRTFTLGFCLTEDELEMYSDDEDAYDYLTVAWRYEITKRREAAEEAGATP